MLMRLVNIAGEKNHHWRYTPKAKGSQKTDSLKKILLDTIVFILINFSH